jgi:hypothetical protein
VFDPTRPVGDGIAVLNILPSFFKHGVKRNAVHQVHKDEPVYLRSFCAEGTNITVLCYSFELFNSASEEKTRA